MIRWFFGSAMVAVLLMCSGPAFAQDAWLFVNSSGNAVAKQVPSDGPAPGETYRVTMTGALSEWLFIGHCALGSTYDAINLAGAGTSIVPQRCATPGCANPVDIVASLSDGDFIVLDFKSKWVRVSGASPSDVVELYCAKGDS